MRPIDADEFLKRVDAEYLSDGFKSYVRTRVKKMPTIEAEPKWIPCSERLPKRGVDVLVTRDYDGREDHSKSCKYVEVASCYWEDEDISWHSYSDEYKTHPRNHRVIAWMPLPKPYEVRTE